MKANRITYWVVSALILGVVVGYLCHRFLPDPGEVKRVAGYFSILTDVFLRMIKMVIAPLVFSTLVHGIASSGDSKSVGRVGLKAMAWFMAASMVSLLLGLIFANVLKPGVGYNLPLPEATAQTGIAATSLNLRDFVTHLFPKSFFEAMADGEVLQIVVFALFFGLAMASFKEKPLKVLPGLIEDAAHVMLKVTRLVMLFAPVGVFGAVASTIAVEGLGILTVYAKFMGAFAVAISALWVVLLAGGYAFLGRGVFTLLSMMRMPLMLAFATATSEAAYPKVLEQLDRMGIKEKISGFVLPLGYSFNLGGSIMYTSFTALFVSQVYNVHLSLGQQFLMLLVLLITSKGIAGVPRASLVVVANVLPMFKLPETGIMLILGIDHFLDMFRSATNVIGNALAAAVVAKSENAISDAPQLTEPLPVEREAA